MSFKKGQYAYLYLIVGLVIAGLIGIQLYWINKTVEVEKNAINRNLNTDFQRLADDIEEYSYCYVLYAKTYVNQYEGIYLIKQKVDEEGNYVPVEKGGWVDTINMYNFHVVGSDTMFENYSSLELNHFSTSLDVKFSFAIEGIMNPQKYSFDKLTSENLKSALDNEINIDTVVTGDYLFERVKEVLMINELDTNCLAGIRKTNEQEFIVLTDTTQKMSDYKDVIEVPIFENSVNSPYVLAIGIPQPFTKIIKSLSVMMISSVIIILILIISYVYFIRTIINERRLSQMKNAFINNITHEFRTPITNINLAIENWRETNKNPAFYYNIIEEENRHLEKNVDQILQLATLKHNGQSLKQSIVNIADIIHAAADSLQMQLNSTKGYITYDMNASSYYLMGNGNELQNMMQNLLDNAIKYSNQPPSIIIRTYDKADKLAIEVVDEGIGMLQQTQQHIFERFYRSDTGDRHDVKGFGLGLSYVKHIVDNHMGSIEVKSKLGLGTTFTVYLPKTENIS